jgi:hypothetical protein
VREGRALTITSSGRRNLLDTFGVDISERRVTKPRTLARTSG